MTISRSSAHVTGSIDDLLIQILLCLPAKSLMRFKLVSKHWESLITSHYFSLLPYSGRNPVVGLICPGRRRSSVFEYIPLDGKNRTKPPFTELSFPGDTLWYWIHQSCNGLVLCCSDGNWSVFSSSYWNHEYQRTQYPIRSCYVYNPTTKCFAKIPRLHRYPRLDGYPVLGVNLAFDPAKSPNYKLVCVRALESTGELVQIGVDSIEHFKIEIYSSESGAWRASGEPFSVTARFSYGVYWNGSIHWICDCPRVLLYFNVNKEKLGKVSLPATISVSEYWIDKSISYFGESCDHLHIVERYGEQTAFSVYEMKRDYSGWFVKYRVDVTMAAAAFPVITNIADELMNIIRDGSIYSLIRVDEVEAGNSFLVLRVCGKLIRYNLDCNTWEEISDTIENAVFDFLLPCAFEHIESLAVV